MLRGSVLRLMNSNTRTQPRWVILLVGVAIAGLALAGCSAVGGQLSVDGRQFLSVPVADNNAPPPLVPGTTIRISFTNGSLSVQAGCNTMGGAYRIDGGKLIVDGAGMTEMACDEPRMAQDDWLFAFIGSRPDIRLSGSDLVLVGATTTITMLDREVAEPDLELVGPTWTLTSIITGDSVSSVPQGVTATLKFAADGRVELHPGCNTGGARVAVDGDTLRFIDIVTTKMACTGAGAQVEQELLALLSADAVRFSIDASVLTLQVGDHGLQFIAS